MAGILALLDWVKLYRISSRYAGESWNCFGIDLGYDAIAVSSGVVLVVCSSLADLIKYMPEVVGVFGSPGRDCDIPGDRASCIYSGQISAGFF